MRVGLLRTTFARRYVVCNRPSLKPAGRERHTSDPSYGCFGRGVGRPARVSSSPFAPAGTFQVASQPIVAAPPAIPLIVPSVLVAHRPDLAAAERRLAVASNQVGIAMTGYFPTVRLMASGGFESEDSKTLIQWGSRFLQAGPSVSLPLFNAGRTRSEVDVSKAKLAEVQAQWQQNVLVAFNEVENALHDQQLLSELNQHDADTVAAAHDVAQLAEARYRGGLVNYLDVVDAQRTELEASRLVAQTVGQRFVASVELVKALGGGWTDYPAKTG